MQKNLYDFWRFFFVLRSNKCSDCKYHLISGKIFHRYNKRGVCMKELKLPLLNDIKIIPQGETISQAKDILMSEEFQNYSANCMQEHLAGFLE